MIRLLVDMHSFDGKPEGITTYLQGLYSAAIPLARSDVHFFLCAGDCENIKGIFGESKNVTYLSIPHSGLMRRILWTYPRLIRQYHIDYAHFQYTIPFRCACKRLVTIHDVFFEDFKDGYSWRYAMPRHLLFKYAARHGEFVFTMCDYSRQRISHHYGIPAERIGLTPNAVSAKLVEDVASSTLDVKRKYGIDGEYILFLSRKEPRKNHAGLIRAYQASRLWEENVHLALVGSLSLPVPGLDAALSQLPSQVRDKVHCIDSVDYPELCAWYRQARAFVFPSLAEGFGIPPLEAAMCCITTLCSNQTSMGEFDFFGDRLVDPTNEDALAQGLWKLVHANDAEQLEQIAGAVQKRYSWEKSAKIILEAIQKDYLQTKTLHTAYNFCGR